MKRAFNFATIMAFNDLTVGLIKNQKDTLEGQKKNLENTVKQLEQEIKSLTAENEAAASEIASMQSQIASLQGTPHGGGSIAGLRAAISALKTKIQANKQKIQAAKAMVISSKAQIQKIGGTLSKIEQQERSVQDWLKKLIPDIQDIDNGASGRIDEKKGDLLRVNGKIKNLVNKFTQKHLSVLNINGTKNYKTGQINKLPNRNQKPNISGLPFDGKGLKATPTVAVVDDAAVGALLLLFALGLISREQVAEAIGATVDAISGILDQLQKGLINIGAAIAGIMQSVTGDDGESIEIGQWTESEINEIRKEFQDPNKKSHILQNKHNWNKLVPDPNDPNNWGKVVAIIENVLLDENSSTKNYKGQSDIFSTTLKVGNEIVEVVWKIVDGVKKIADAWVQ